MSKGDEGPSTSVTFDTPPPGADAERSLVATTNKPFSAWADVFPNANLAVAFVDRLVYRAEILTMEADSIRLRGHRARSARRGRRSESLDRDGTGRSATGDEHVAPTLGSSAVEAQVTRDRPNPCRPTTPWPRLPARPWGSRSGPAPSVSTLSQRGVQGRRDHRQFRVDLVQPLGERAH